MSPDDQLLYESRVRNRQAAVAILAGVLLIVASVVQFGGPHPAVSELTTGLLNVNERSPRDLVASVVNALASGATVVTLLFLLRCSKARNPQIRGFIKWVAIAAGTLVAIGGIYYAAVLQGAADTFATTGAQTYDEAKHLIAGSGFVISQVMGQVGALLMAVSFVLVSMQAMRVGLLPKLLGYLGMFAGALTIIPITQVPVVQLFWLVAVGYLISGRWPTGVPAAWRTGRAETLPSGPELRAQRAAARGGGPARPAPGHGGAATRGRNGAGTATAGRAPGGLAGWLAGRTRPAPAPDIGSGADTDEAPAGSATPDPRTRAGTPKRKRKRRR